MRVLRQISWEEAEERRANGVCMFCEELETSNHYLKHKGLGLLMMDSDDESILEPETISEVESLVKLSMQKKTSIPYEVIPDETDLGLVGEATELKSSIQEEMVISKKARNEVTVADLQQKSSKTETIHQLVTNSLEPYDQFREKSMVICEDSHNGCGFSELMSIQEVHLDEFVKVGDVNCQLFTDVKIQFNAHQVFDKMLRRGRSRKEQNKTKFFKSWRFKYKYGKKRRRRCNIRYLCLGNSCEIQVFCLGNDKKMRSWKFWKFKPKKQSRDDVDMKQSLHGYTSVAGTDQFAQKHIQVLPEMRQANVTCRNGLIKLHGYKFEFVNKYEVSPKNSYYGVSELNQFPFEMGHLVSRFVRKWRDKGSSEGWSLLSKTWKFKFKSHKYDSLIINAPSRARGVFKITEGSASSSAGNPDDKNAAPSGQKLELDGMVVTGGDDSNTNVCLLPENLGSKNLKTGVSGCYKTIDGDLKCKVVPTSFGFDTACKIYSEMIGNDMIDARLTGNNYYFVRLIGCVSSHITLECALQTHPNITVLGEEVYVLKQTLKNLTDYRVEVICKRVELGYNYGVILIPECLIDSIPEVQELITELNEIQAIKVDKCAGKVSQSSYALWDIMLHRGYQVQEQPNIWKGNFIDLDYENLDKRAYYSVWHRWLNKIQWLCKFMKRIHQNMKQISLEFEFVVILSRKKKTISLGVLNGSMNANLQNWFTVYHNSKKQARQHLKIREFSCFMEDGVISTMGAYNILLLWVKDTNNTMKKKMGLFFIIHRECCVLELNEECLQMVKQQVIRLGCYGRVTLRCLLLLCFNIDWRALTTVEDMLEDSEKWIFSVFTLSLVKEELQSIPLRTLTAMSSQTLWTRFSKQGRFDTENRREDTCTKLIGYKVRIKKVHVSYGDWGIMQWRRRGLFLTENRIVCVSSSISFFRTFSLLIFSEYCNDVLHLCKNPFFYFGFFAFEDLNLCFV